MEKNDARVGTCGLGWWLNFVKSFNWQIIECVQHQLNEIMKDQFTHVALTHQQFCRDWDFSTQQKYGLAIKVIITSVPSHQLSIINYLLYLIISSSSISPFVFSAWLYCPREFKSIIIEINFSAHIISNCFYGANNYCLFQGAGYYPP